MGRMHSAIVRLIAIRGFQDTQCGFKMFSRQAAEDLFRVQQIQGIGFDVELLLIARSRGYQIKQVPITWHYDSDSRIQLVKDSLGMLRDTWRCGSNLRHGVYAPRPRRSRRPRRRGKRLEIRRRLLAAEHAPRHFIPLCSIFCQYLAKLPLK